MNTTPPPDPTRNPLHEAVVQVRDKEAALSLETLGEAFNKLLESANSTPEVGRAKGIVHAAAVQALAIWAREIVTVDDGGRLTRDQAGPLIDHMVAPMLVAIEKSLVFVGTETAPGEIDAAGVKAVV